MARLPIGLAMALTLCGQVSASEYSKLTGDQLAEFVRQDCGSCHGMTLNGGLGRPLTPEALSAFDVEALRDIVLNGVPGTAMPPWQGVLTADQADWIARNLKQGTLK